MSRNPASSAIQWLFAAAVYTVLFSPGAAGAAKRGEDARIRTVKGVVSNAQGTAVNGAVVQLKNIKTLQIRSYITKDKGTYYFHGLSTNVDYELKAGSGGNYSGPKTLSSFDSRPQAVMNLKLNRSKSTPAR